MTTKVNLSHETSLLTQIMTNVMPRTVFNFNFHFQMKYITHYDIKMIDIMDTARKFNVNLKKIVDHRL